MDASWPIAVVCVLLIVLIVTAWDIRAELRKQNELLSGRGWLFDRIRDNTEYLRGIADRLDRNAN